MKFKISRKRKKYNILLIVSTKKNDRIVYKIYLLFNSWWLIKEKNKSEIKILIFKSFREYNIKIWDN